MLSDKHSKTTAICTTVDFRRSLGGPLSRKLIANYCGEPRTQLAIKSYVNSFVEIEHSLVGSAERGASACGSRGGLVAWLGNRAGICGGYATGSRIV